MATRRKYREQYLRWHKGYEKRASTELNKLFRSWMKDIDFENMQIGTYKLLVSLAINEEDLTKAYINIYREIGRVHGKRVGKDTDRQSKAFDIDSFLSLFDRNVASFLREFGAKRIVSVRQSLFESIVDLLSKRVESGMDIRQAANEVKKIVNKPKFYKWRALRIARTESTAASNYAALQTSVSQRFETVKEWISATDRRTRRKPEDEFDHLAMDGKQIPVEDDFVFTSTDGTQDRLLFPGDPKGDGSNVINCRCTVAIIPKRDKEGNLIRKI